MSVWCLVVPFSHCILSSNSGEQQPVYRIHVFSSHLNCFDWSVVSCEKITEPLQLLLSSKANKFQHSISTNCRSCQIFWLQGLQLGGWLEIRLEQRNAISFWAKHMFCMGPGDPQPLTVLWLKSLSLEVRDVHASTDAFVLPGDLLVTDFPRGLGEPCAPSHTHTCSQFAP